MRRNLFIVLLILAVVIASTSLPALAQGITNFSNVVLSDDMTVGDDLTVNGLITNPIGEENIGLPSVVSAAVTTASSGGIFTIQDGEIWVVHNVLVKVGANFNCTGDNCTMIIGDSNDTDGFITLTDAQLQAADTEGTGFAAGWQGMAEATRGVYLDEATNASAHPFVYAPSGADETIDIAIGGTSPTGGTATVYVIYTRIQ